jgi:hypothetical protein
LRTAIAHHGRQQHEGAGSAPGAADPRRRDSLVSARTGVWPPARRRPPASPRRRAGQPAREAGRRARE